jgi:hypothetical protein
MKDYVNNGSIPVEAQIYEKNKKQKNPTSYIM